MWRDARVIGSAIAVVCLLTLDGCRPREPEAPLVITEDPILAVGHGSFIGADGEPIRPTTTFIEATQAFYVKDILRNAEELRQETEERRRILDEVVPDRIVANALLLDWLIEAAVPARRAHLANVNNALRWHYLLEIRQLEPPPLDTEWWKGVDPETGKRLQERGFKVLSFTTSAGRQYVEECRAAGVPVPNFIFGSEWVVRGEVTNEFLSSSWKAELWEHGSAAPAGVCLALPRYEPAGGGFSDDATLLGVICLGTQTSKACFFDNPRGRKFRRAIPVSINEFVGGVDLVPNGQGVCSDCHAGENPFVVHPEKPPFAAVGSSMVPLGWHDPLVDASWPRNPGPTNLLDATSSVGRCDSCHRVASAGRFPELSTQLPDYCSVVLGTASGTSVKATMPPFGLDRSQFINHINALQAACNAPPPTPGVEVPVDVRDDPAFISAPMVIDPLYQCATQVAVRSGILDAKLTLQVNGVDVDSVLVRDPNHEVLNVPALVAGDIVTASQELGGMVSGPSAPVTVRDHTVDFPAGLPIPAIDPTLVYQCASVVAVRHVPGATITVFSNGGDPRSRTTSTGWSAIRPGKQPFDIGDVFTAEQALCADRSGLSPPVSAVTAPSSLPPAAFKPPQTYQGQQLVTVENLTNGSTTRIAEATSGPLGGFSTPVSWWPDFDAATPLGRPLGIGDRLVAEQQLCDVGSRSETPPAVSCRELPAPRIRHPRAGDTYVVVIEAVPGARIRIYDATGDELGDGSGTVINLKRALTNADTITAVQQVDDCTSSNGFLVSVRLGD